MKFSGTLISLLLVATWAGAEEFVIRETKQGKVRGKLLQVLNVTVEEYIGIPFAESPVGNLRFKPPIPRTPWNGIYEATGKGTECPQPSFPGRPTEGLNHTEDCLQLNVWAPAQNQSTRVPVYVWFHGGGFAIGSSTIELYNGIYFAATSGLVVVSMNYRLGVLGFLNANSTDTPGNVGLLDQNLALKWVRDNIEAFGGDPATVTIAGVSAGSVSVHAHVLSPLSQGLFRRAVMMSGTANSGDFINTPEENFGKGNDVARRVGCAHDGDDLARNAEQILSCLRRKSADELVLAASQIEAPKLFVFFPTYSDQFLPYSPLEAVKRELFNDVDILAGTTSDEGAISLLMSKTSEFPEITSEVFDKDELKRSVYGPVKAWTKFEVPDMLEYYERRAAFGGAEALRRGYIDYLSDKVFNCPLQFFIEKCSSRGNEVYRYIFGQKWHKMMIPDWMGTPHGGDTFYAFARPLVFQNDFSEVDKVVSHHLVGTIASFCKYGVPNLANGTVWKKYTPHTPVSVFIANDNVTEVNEYRKEECEQWRRFL